MDVSSFIDNALGVTPNKQLSPYDDLIEESASRHDVDPDFIRAVMGTESAFNPKAKSPKDAHGLMQLIPGTARRMGVKNIYDPKENIEGGTKYLKQLLDMFGGDVNLALAGYNAGEGAVQKYGNKIPPYKETRKYVKQITGNYQGSGYHPTKVANSFIDGVLGGDTPTIDPADNFIDSVLSDEDTIYGQPANAYTEPPPPALETDDTILAQLKVASDPKKPRKGVFFPENDTERALQIAQSLDQKEWGLFPDKQNKGYQLVHLPSAKKLKLRSATDIQTYIDKNPNALVTLTSKAYNAGRNTGDDQQTVATIDPKTGVELTASVVTPETRDAQVALDKANHPEGVSVDTTTNAVVAKRLGETGEELLDPNVIATAQPMVNQPARQPLEDMSQVEPDVNALYADFLQQVGIPDSQEARAEFNLAQKASVEGANKQNRIDAPRQTQGVKQPAITQGKATKPTGTQSQKYANATYELPLSNKNGSYTSSYNDEVASRLASELNVPYEVARSVVEQNPIKFEDGTSVDDAYLAEVAKAGKSINAQIGGSVKRQIVEAAKQVADKQKVYREKLDEYAQTEAPSVADLMARKDAGLGVTDDEIKAEREAYQKALEAKGLAGTVEDPYAAGIASGELSPETRRAVRIDIKAANADLEAKRQKFAQDILKDSGSFVKYQKDQERIKDEYANRPLAEPLEFAKNLAGAVPKALASVLKTGDLALNMSPLKIAFDQATGRGFKIDETSLSAIGDNINRYIEKNRNPDLKDKWYINMLPDTIGQLATQITAGVLTGGATLPTIIGASMGAAAQYDEAKKFNADDKQKMTAAVVGALAAIPDAVLFSKWFKGADEVAQTGFIKSLTQSLMSKLGVKYGEEVAAEVTKASIKQFAGNILKNAGFEGVQEVSENKINDWLALNTFDPSAKRREKLLSITDEDVSSFLGGLIGGAGGGAIETYTENLSADAQENLFEKSQKEVDRLLEQGEITPTKATEIKAVIAQASGKPKPNKVTLEPVEDIAKSDIPTKVSESFEKDPGTADQRYSFQKHKDGVYRRDSETGVIEKVAEPDNGNEPLLPKSDTPKPKPSPIRERAKREAAGLVGDDVVEGQDVALPDTLKLPNDLTDALKHRIAKAEEYGHPAKEVDEHLRDVITTRLDGFRRNDIATTLKPFIDKARDPAFDVVKNGGQLWKDAHKAIEDYDAKVEAAKATAKPVELQTITDTDSQEQAIAKFKANPYGHILPVGSIVKKGNKEYLIVGGDDSNTFNGLPVNSELAKQLRPLIDRGATIAEIKKAIPNAEKETWLQQDRLPKNKLELVSLQKPQPTKAPAVVEGEAAKGDVVRDFVLPNAKVTRPLADKGLTSYRYRTDSGGHVAIGAKDNTDALNEAGRSITGKPDIAKLDVWNGTEYVPVTSTKPDTPTLKSLLKLGYTPAFSKTLSAAERTRILDEGIEKKDYGKDVTENRFGNNTQPVESKGQVHTSIEDAPDYGVYAKRFPDGTTWYGFKKPDGNPDGAGNRLVATAEDAQREADRYKKEVEYRKETAERQEAKRIADEQEKESRKPIADFDAGLSPMQRGKIQKSLNKLWNIDGKHQTTKQYVEDAVKSGTLELDSYDENRIKDMTRQQFNRATNEQQQRHEQRIKDGGKVTKYLVNGLELGKTAYDYAAHLQNKSESLQNKSQIKSEPLRSVSDDDYISGHKKERSRLMRIRQQANADFVKNPTPEVYKQVEIADKALTDFEDETKRRAKDAPALWWKESEPLRSVPDIIDSKGKTSSVEKGEALRSTPDQNRDLFAAHNLSAANVMHADRLGGIALPSIAIASTRHPFDGFGEITLLAKPDLIDPKNKVPVVNADMYSPRYPSEKIYVDGQKFEKLWKPVKENWEKHYPDASVNFSKEHWSPAETLKQDGLRGLVENEMFEAYFLAENGHKLPDNHRELFSTIYNKYDDEIADAALDFIEKADGQSKYFKGWTPSGNKRLGDYNLSNIVAQMKSEMKEGEGFMYGAANVRSKAAKRFKSITEIQKDRDKIIPSEKMEAIKDQMNDRLHELEQNASSHYEYASGGDLPNALLEGLRTKNVARTLREYGYDEDLDLEPIRQFIEELKHLPSEYFEAKPQRAVQLNEFETAVVPDNLSPKVRAVLEKNGLNIVEYKRGDKAARHEAVKKAGTDANILFKVRTTEDSAELTQLAKSRNFSTDIVPHLKVSIDKGQFGKSILSLDNNQTVEFARTLLAITSDVSRDKMTAIDGLFLDPQQVANIRDAALGVQDAFADKGKDTKPIEAFVKALDKAASVNGTVQLEAFENARKHETGHAASYLGAKEKALINRRSGLKELADTDPKFAGAFNKWAKIEGRAWTAKNATPAQLAHGAEEVATYIADGQHSRLGLTYAQGIKLGVELQLRYAQARIDEGAANVAEALAIFDGTIFEQYKEAINEREQSNQSDKGNVESKGAGQGNEYQGRDPGTKESDGDGVSSVGAEFTPGGEEKLSKTPSTLRKGGIPVQERLYTSTTDAERQSFANERMDGGLDAAMKWTRDQLDTKNNNAGATGVVGVNVMMQLGKEGRIAELNKFADDLLPAYTDSAQMIQSLAVVSMFSPDTAGAYVTKVAKQNGQDVTPEQVEKALDIAGRMSEVVQADGISEAALNEATAENERLKKDIADLEEALGLANDKNKEFKGKLSGQGRTIAALRRQIEGEDKGKTRLPGAVRKHVKEITERKDDILERLKQKYGGNPILQMVAPNSQANFDEWFGDSKVVDENGKPLVVYHGTNQDVDAFSPEKRSTKTGNVNAQLGHFFTDNKAEASRYASDWGKDNGNVVPVFLSIQNPYTMPYKEINDLAMGEFHRWTEGATKEDLIRNREDALNAVRERRAELIAEGYDGVFAKIGGKNEYIAFYPNQIKSAIGNNGEYSRDNDSILRSTPNELDQDAVDAATYHLSKNLGKQTPTQVKDAINVLTNGQLTPEQINDVYAAAVSALRIERTAMDADTKAANKLRQSHYREADKINDAKLTDWEKKLNKADSKFVNTTVREGVENGYTDEAIWFALARKHYPSVNDALKALREEFPDADTRTIIRDSERLTQAVKRRLIGDIAQRQNEFSLNETDIDLIKEERRVNTFEKQKVVREANRFYSGMVKDAGEIILDTIVNFRRANLLTAVKTHFVNIGGNVGFAVGEEVARVPSTWVDLVASIFTGERTTALSPYAIGNGLKALVSQDETLKNSKWDTPEGKERGVTAAKHVLQYGGSIADMERLQHSESILSAKFENRPAKWMDNYINGVFKLLGAEDAFFKVYAFRRHIEEQARAIAMTERRKDKNVDVKERTKELVQNPTNVMQVQADRYAHFMTFQNDNALSEFIASIKRGRPKTKAAVETIMPYDRTPTNIVMRVLEYTPVGTVAAPIRWRSAQKAFARNKPSAMKFRNELTGAVKADLAQSEDFNALPETEKRKIVEATLQKVFTREQQEQFAKTIGRSGIGTGLFSLGFVLAAAGLMAGAMSFDDDDKAESNEFEKRKKAGIENGSILTPWGRIVLPKSPATIAMVGGATFYEQMKMSKKSVLMSAVNAGVEAFSDMATELPLINSTYSVVRSLGKGKYGEFVGNVASGFVPVSAMVRSISEVTDEKERTGSSYREGEKILTTEDWFRKQGRGLKNSFLKGIPIARNYLVDESTLGVSESERGGWGRRLIRTIDPFNTRSPNDYEAPGPPRDYKGELNDLQRQRGATTDAKEKERLTKEIDAILAEQKVNREVAKETKIALGNQSAVQKLKEVGSVDELLKNNSVRYWSTDDWVAVLDSPDLSDADRQLATDALRKKADNASKAKSLTPQELERVKKVIPDYAPKMRKLADLVYGKQGITSDWQINEPDLDAPGDYKVDTIKRPTKPDPRSEPILEAYKKVMWKANYDSTDMNLAMADKAGQILLRRIKNIPLTTAQIEAMEQVNPQMAAALKWKEQRQSQNVIDMRER